MKTKLQSIAKGAALGLASVAIAVIMSSCDVPIRASVIAKSGAYTYAYSAKGGLELEIHPTK